MSESDKEVTDKIESLTKKYRFYRDRSWHYKRFLAAMSKQNIALRDALKPYASGPYPTGRCGCVMGCKSCEDAKEALGGQVAECGKVAE